MSTAGQLECAEAQSMGDMTIGCYAPGCGAGTEDTDWGCQGDDYRFAIDGLEYRIHCAAYGFATCREETCAN